MARLRRGTPKLQELWDSFRAGDPVCKVAYEAEIGERQREERAKRDDARREAFKRMPTREAIRASIGELKGGEPAAEVRQTLLEKETHRPESVRDSIQRSLQELAS